MLTTRLASSFTFSADSCLAFVFSASAVVLFLVRPRVVTVFSALPASLAGFSAVTGLAAADLLSSAFSDFSDAVFASVFAAVDFAAGAFASVFAAVDFAAAAFVSAGLAVEAEDLAVEVFAAVDLLAAGFVVLDLAEAVLESSLASALSASTFSAAAFSSTGLAGAAAVFLGRPLRALVAFSTGFLASAAASASKIAYARCSLSKDLIFFISNSLATDSSFSLSILLSSKRLCVIGK